MCVCVDLFEPHGVEKNKMNDICYIHSEFIM